MKASYTTMDRAQQAGKLRLSTWFNSDTSQHLFGIEANLAYGKWAHVVGFDKRLLLFSSRQEAKEGIARIQFEAERVKQSA